MQEQLKWHLPLGYQLMTFSKIRSTLEKKKVTGPEIGPIPLETLEMPLA